MKLDDIPFVINDINKEMPYLTDKTVKIPYTFQQFPKSLKKEAEKVDNKYLNNHLATIQEIEHRFPNHPLPDWMKHYQNRYFKANLAHDGFFKCVTNFESRLKEYKSMNLTNVGFVGRFKKVIGADLISGGTGTSGTGWSGFVRAYSTSGGVIGAFYNQQAINIQIASGNYNLAVYDDNGSSQAGNLISGSPTGSTSASTGFNLLNSGSEFSISTTTPWLAWQVDNNSLAPFFNTSGGTEDRSTSFSYAAFPSTFTLGATSVTEWVNMKIHHT